jgi:hypothetical protein
MRDVINEHDAWPGAPVALATVIEVKRSASPAPGAHSAINDHGEVAHRHARARGRRLDAAGRIHAVG